jgi:hypothetical protein
VYLTNSRSILILYRWFVYSNPSFLFSTKITVVASQISSYFHYILVSQLLFLVVFKQICGLYFLWHSISRLRIMYLLIIFFNYPVFVGFISYINGTFRINLKSSIFWNITPCSPVKVNQRFGGPYSLDHQDREVNQAKHKHVAGSKHSSASRFLAWFTCIPWWWRWCVPPKRRLDLTGLHSVISQKNIFSVKRPFHMHMCL